MTGSGVPDDDMPNFLWPSRTDVPPVGDAALDAVLGSAAGSGAGSGADTAPDSAAALRPVAEVLGALRGAPSRAELAGLDRALAAFRSGVGTAATSPWPPRRRTPVARRALLSIKVATAAAIAGVAALGAASYAGALPATLQRFAHDTIAAPAVKGSHGRGDPALTPVSAPVPTATAHRWCTTLLSGGTAAAQRATLTRRLAANAGGSGHVTAYCALILGHGTASAEPRPGSPSPPGRAVGRTGSQPPGNALGRTKHQPPGKAVGRASPTATAAGSGGGGRGGSGRGGSGGGGGGGSGGGGSGGSGGGQGAGNGNGQGNSGQGSGNGKLAPGQAGKSKS